MKALDDFTGLFPLSKTLRFELQPQGRTLEYIQKNSLLEQDQHRADSYVKVKKLIDEYHKAFIEDVLAQLKLPCQSVGKKDSLEELYTCYMCGSKDEAQKKVLEEIQEKLRKIIAAAFSKDERFKRLDKKELIKEDLLSFVDDLEKRKLVEEFKDFTTYFTGFHENRHNMYVADAKSTAIAYRIINENLPRFIDNMTVFDKVAVSPVAENFGQLYLDFEEYLNVCEIAEMFRLGYYNIVMKQSQIEVYNTIIGGKTLDDGRKIQGLNEYINLYNQSQKDKHLRLPKLKPLYKQILSDRDSISWLPEKFNSDNELLDAVENSYQELCVNVFDKLRTLLKNISDYNISRIYLRNDLQLTNISQQIFAQYNKIKNVLYDELVKVVPRKSKKETDESYKERVYKILKSRNSISIAEIENCFAGIEDHKNIITRYIVSFGRNDVLETDLIERIELAYSQVKDILNVRRPREIKLIQDKNAVEKIKNLLDAIKALQVFVKPLLGDGNEPEKDAKFYGEFIQLWDDLDKITPLYNMVRNYVTSKPYSVEKIKLNFENSTLLGGWDVNKEHDNTAVILRKDGYYFLAIINKRYKSVFDIGNTPISAECYDKMDYKLLPGANKMLPKVFFSSSRIDEFAPSERIMANYNKGTHKKGDNFSLEDCHELIDFFKASINKHEDWKNFGFSFSDTSTYEDISAFYKEVEQQGYKVTFRPVSKSYIDTLVDEGKLYLFKIYNKDFSPYSKGKPNLHTMYWNMLFDNRNLTDVVYKLSGGAEVFFRKSSPISKEATHCANVPVVNKNPLNKKKESVFSYDLIKDRRYTIDKFQFHVPITMNFKNQGVDNINLFVNEYIRQSKDLHVVGIDRGERNLLYVTVIDMNGNIVDKRSFNILGNTDYHDLLARRERERDDARKSWQTIENIKNLKEGYLSLAIHEITKLMIKYNAIVVLEDLNSGFMRGRQKVERQVYQKFEKMLIDKLNYLVDKDAQPDEPGGLLRAYQLTSKFDTFKNKGKQCGFLFYIPAWNTSKIDSVTGFVNLFDTRYETISKTRDFFGRFDSIKYNNERDWFEFAFDYNNFTTKADGTRTHWTVCTYGERIETKRDAENNSNFVSIRMSVTDELKKLFLENSIDLNCDIKSAILEQNTSKFFESLLRLFRLTLQMRNSEVGNDTDYILSPVIAEDGRFFNTNDGREGLPENADANGAYNIARKGLWVIQQIKAADDLKKIKLAITNKEWLRFVQEKTYLVD